MMCRKPICALILTVLSLIVTSCNTAHISNQKESTVNSKASEEKPYLILISLDGFRWDYVERFNPPHLTKFINQGVKATSLIPSFPSKTFPNHYTIATGLYPDNHGLLGNSYYSYKQNLTYSIGNRELVEDGSFYKGTPIWVYADKNQMVTASYFFVGSEANIQNIRPTYYYPYDGSVKNSDRIAQVIKWLELPSKNRPHLITMYFSDMDDVGHRFGPNNDEKIKTALFELDENLGNLFREVKQSKLPVNIIIVSDHGMTSITADKYIPVETIENDDLYLTVNNGSIVNIHPKNNVQIDSVFTYLQNKENHFKVYKTENTPGFEYQPKNKDWGSFQVLPELGYYFGSQSNIEKRLKFPDNKFGVHGYDPDFKDMHGIFYANGPAFKMGYEIPSVKNIHLFPLMCELLDLKVPKDIDGRLSEMKSVFKN